jgi:hypothetical protein
MAVSTTRRAELLVARLLRGAVGGMLSGVVFAAVAMWYADSTGGSAGVPLQMISTIATVQHVPTLGRSRWIPTEVRASG